VDLVGESTARREAWRRRVLSLAAAVAVAFVGLVGQLWYLQVLEGVKLQELSEKNRIRIRPVAAPRGILFDRNGLALVDNRPAFTLSLIPREMDDRDTVLARLAVLLKLPMRELEESLERVPPDSFRPVRVRRGLTLEEVTKVEERKLELPGVLVEVEGDEAAARGAAMQIAAMKAQYLTRDEVPADVVESERSIAERSHSSLSRVTCASAWD